MHLHRWKEEVRRLLVELRRLRTLDGCLAETWLAEQVQLHRYEQVELEVAGSDNVGR